MRLLVACHDIVLAGGLLRFERVARELCAWGHELNYVALTSNRNTAWESDFPVLTIEEAMQQKWTSTMVPGAGFPDVTISKFALLRSENFGYRIQHILNDLTVKQGFLAVNEAFKPDLVIFNNLHWVPGSFTDFQARKFFVLEGAVDTARFSPKLYRKPLSGSTKVVIGGLATKNPGPLIEALRLLPDNFVLHLLGPYIEMDFKIGDLLKTGRLRFTGQLTEEQLPGFYNDVDIVVHTEEIGGWTNLVAEAMASGVPVVCTRHGTASFAIHNETVLLLSEVTGNSIKEAVLKLCDDTSATTAMARNARGRICNFNWTSYASRLLALCLDDGQFHYTYAPELGLHGKWPLSDRLRDLDYIFEHCEDKTVLDLGCAEGVVAQKCLEHGARLVHGFDVEKSRVKSAERLCADYCNAQVFLQANLDEWVSWKCLQEILLTTYDIVLYLGIQHHLIYPERLATLADAASMAGKIFVIRTTNEVYQRDDIVSVLTAEGFDELCLEKHPQREVLGVARIFVRK